MNGNVDRSGRAPVTIHVRPLTATDGQEVQAWIDTGFTGDLVLPQKQVDRLSLAPSAIVKAILADGSDVMLKTYSCLVDWFDVERQLEVVANDGEDPLLGVGLLQGRDLIISYRSGNVSIN